MPREAEVGPSVACVDPSRQGPKMGDSKKCGLYVNDSPPRLVALGRVYEGSTTVHNVSLGDD